MGRFASPTHQPPEEPHRVSHHACSNSRSSDNEPEPACSTVVRHSSTPRATWSRPSSISDARQRPRRRSVPRASPGEGQVGSYIHHDAKVGALVEVSCETDFVARTEDFRTLVRHVAEQVAATSPDVLETEACAARTAVDSRPVANDRRPRERDGCARRRERARPSLRAVPDLGCVIRTGRHSERREES